ncbi:hypothetical protein SCNRRL3882_0578 [Streptomyces chartreusis NRRL 3882]|uniref:Uncharacterized protein n=1 Tax=Streptomyces chartreusis NRRL 3882 TaxID=1079985 RepID=A0A2N9B1A1_STRCX|nr:hypothetical protein SCNRRL3882_0578 [Streptomyces chartreusis NRRL 3882]
MLKVLTAELLADTGKFGPVARTAVVADPAPALVAGARLGSYTDSGPRPLSEVGAVHRPALHRWPGDHPGVRLG